MVMADGDSIYGSLDMFLCSGNHYLSRFAEEHFNAVARSLRLPWRADSRGLVKNIRSLGNAGSILVNTQRALVASKAQRPPVALARLKENVDCLVSELRQR